MTEEMAWCTTCSRWQAVMDSDTDYVLDGTMSITYETEYAWRSYACGHQDSWPTGKSYSTYNY